MKQFSFQFIELEIIGSRPGFDVVNTITESKYGISMFTGFHDEIDLCIVSIDSILKATVRTDDLPQRTGVQAEHQRPNHRALWYTIRDGECSGICSVNNNFVTATFQIRFKPL